MVKRQTRNILVIIGVIGLLIVFGFLGFNLQQTAFSPTGIDVAQAELVNDDTNSADYRFRFSGDNPSGVFDSDREGIIASYDFTVREKLDNSNDAPLQVEGLKVGDKSLVSTRVDLTPPVAFADPLASDKKQSEVEFIESFSECSIISESVANNVPRFRIDCRFYGKVTCYYLGEQTNCAYQVVPSGSTTVTFLKEGTECTLTEHCEDGFQCEDNLCVELVLESPEEEPSPEPTPTPDTTEETPDTIDETVGEGIETSEFEISNNLLIILGIIAVGLIIVVVFVVRRR